jgi:UDP-3-O-[3-hydroxymyristoyl] glucosamine N-acyltransferase
MVKKINPSAYIDSKAQISDGCFVGANAQIYGDVYVGSNSIISSNVIIYGKVEIGEGTFIGPNVVIGFPERSQLLDALGSETLRMEPFKGRLVKIGKKVVIRSNCTVYSNSVIGDSVQFGHNVLIRENVSIGELTTVGTNVVVDGSCTIGRHVSIQTGVYIPTYTTIEDEVFLGPNCVLTNDWYLSRKEYKLRGPLLRRSSSVGGNAVIFPGIIVGEGAVVGAGAVVNKDVPPRVVVAGVPAKKIKDVPSDWVIP